MCTTLEVETREKLSIPEPKFWNVQMVSTVNLVESSGKLEVEWMDDNIDSFSVNGVFVCF